MTSAGRIVGGLAGAFWVLALAAGLFGEGAGEGTTTGEASDVESAGIVVLVVLNVASVAIAFGRERLGGTFLVVAGSAFSFYALASAGHNHVLAMLVSGGPFLASGLLFLGASRR